MPDTTVTVRVTRGEFRYDREHYERGDELEVHEGALEKHPRTLERVEEDEGVQESEAADEDDAEQADVDEEVASVDELDPHPADLKVPELKDRLEDVDSVELLEAIREAEVESEDRTTAKDAIDARLKELEG